MLSFEELHTNTQQNVQDYDSDALTYLKRQINIGLHILEAELGSFYTEETITRDTVAETGSYSLPTNFVRLKQAFVTVDETTQYNLEEVYTEDLWQALQASLIDSYSDSATHVICRRDTFEIFPGAETADNVITLRYEAGGKDLQNDDETTGTITTLANSSAAVVGASTAFTSAMIGRFFKIDDDNSWYRISAVADTTHLTLDRTYEGVAVAAATDSYTIGEMPRTPGPTHHIPGLYAEWQYYKGFKQNDTKARLLREDFFGAMRMAKETYSKRYSSNYIPGRSRRGMSGYNPNFPPRPGSLS